MGLIGAMTELLTWPGRRAYYGATDIAGFSASIKSYLDSMSLSEGMPAADGFDIYEGTRANNVDSFSKVLVPGGKSIAEKLKENKPGADYVRDAITQALEFKNTTETARTEFNEIIAAITADIKDPESNYDPRNVVSYLTEVKTIACNAIEAQHSAEQDALKAKFNDQNFVNILTSSLELTPPAQVEQVKKDMLAALTASQKTELETFTKSLDEPIKKMHAEAQKERDRVAFLANLYEHNAAMKKRIDDLYELNRGQGPIQIDVDATSRTAKFKGIKVEDLTTDAVPTLESVCGRRIHHSKADNTFSMTLPNRFFSSSYFRGGLDRMKGDMMSMAQAVRAVGSDTITMTVRHPLDKDHAMELGRQAYEACRATGFDPKKITIEVDGKKMSANELFANAPSRKKAAEDRGEEYNSTSTEVAKGEHGTLTMQRYKIAIQERRQDARAAAAAAQPAANEDQADAPVRRQ